MSRRADTLPIEAPAICADLTPSRLSISGGCTVTTLETALEAAWSALTFQAVHNLPAVIVCDAPSYDLLRSMSNRWPSNVILRQLDFPPTPNVRRHNHYHRPEAIAAKMSALELSVEALGDAVFFDADMTFFERLPAPQDAQLMLSHNYECWRTNGQHGLYNAGLVWTSSLEFVRWWKQQYMSGRSHFYEQSILDLAPSKWRSTYFGCEHNWGFWRGPIGRHSASSIHCHLSDALDSHTSPWMANMVRPLRSECWRRIHTHSILSSLPNPIET